MSEADHLSHVSLQPYVAHLQLEVKDSPPPSVSSERASGPVMVTQEAKGLQNFPIAASPWQEKVLQTNNC